MALLGFPKYLTIHCSATKEGMDYDINVLNADDIRKFGGKSYHIIIKRDGTIIWNLPFNIKGAHVGGHNSNNLGMCFIGGLAKDAKTPKDTRTQAQIASMRYVIAQIKKQFGNVFVLGHRDWKGVAKACPCFDVRKDVNLRGVI